jgi:hypothetical protein
MPTLLPIVVATLIWHALIIAAIYYFDLGGPYETSEYEYDPKDLNE